MKSRIRKILDEIPKEFIDAMTYYSTVCHDPACTWRKCLEMKMEWELKENWCGEFKNKEEV